ncbi:DgyrCDS8331 [Dimorphilus gyrociliatus]|uniref:Probable ATP-dependent RNA helicase DDX46 n=1 Tax=Dimorphilus gyrociliatus TaxID=2664684 RepID=A0A7I8VVD9_9ANNE|nr:DgyrCDS8331 [Dimorphilus gyrociliatus]
MNIDLRGNVHGLVLTLIVLSVQDAQEVAQEIGDVKMMLHHLIEDVGDQNHERDEADEDHVVRDAGDDPIVDPEVVKTEKVAKIDYSPEKTSPPPVKSSNWDIGGPEERKKKESLAKGSEGATVIKEAITEGQVDKDEEQKRLEEEMKKRRERIERWRAERKKKPDVPEVLQTAKKWTLEDDDDDDEEGNGEKKEEEKKENGEETLEVKKDEPPQKEAEEEEEEEEDPLELYMQSVQNEVKMIEKQDLKNSKVTVIKAVARPKKKRGELMESNADMMEYSSEEDEEDLNDAMAGLRNKKKELVMVDHSKIYYRPFRKDFYVEVPELQRMTSEEVEQYRQQLEGIKIRGKHCPKPIKNWAQAGVSKRVMESLKKNSFDKPTPIQSQAIPAVMSGRDLIGIAKTGSGKTLAFIIPMFRHILDQEPLDDEDGPIAIVLTPTRELAMQIVKECKKFTKNLNLRAVAVYGGTGISEQIAELKKKCEIVVCTPGRMIDMLAANGGRVTNLRRITYVVLDEADRMFDMGFEPQVMRIIDNVRPDRQTVMFSATFPRQMEALARRILNKPLEIQVGGRSVVCAEVTQHVLVLEEDTKFLKLLELLGIYQEEGSVLVFVDKQENADDLMKVLLKHSYPCMSLHGGIDQYDRDSIIVDFKNGSIRLLVATSVAARGLDVKQLNLVVNYDAPNHYEDYVHRCGRTGRAGNKGFAYTFITRDQARHAGDIIKALELSSSKVPDDLRELWDDYKREQEAQGRTVKSKSGFGGKGFKFDESEAQAVEEKKKLQKKALGLQDSDDEDVSEDIEQQIEDMFQSKRRVTDVSTPAVTTAPAATPTPQTTTQKTANIDKLQLAKELANKINAQKKPAEAGDLSQQKATAAFLKDGVIQPILSSKTYAERIAANLNAKLGYSPSEGAAIRAMADDEKDGAFKKYEEELEINDFPQSARWKVTSKEALAQIMEYSDAGITVRGTYVPTGKNPPEDERKLYLAIEATTELAIQKARKEVTRLIKEELLRLSTSSGQTINKGRYKVL